MTKFEYEEKKEEIIKRLGKPVFELFEPVNDSAKELTKLKNEYKALNRYNKQEEKNKGLNTDELKRKYKHIDVPEIFLNNEELKQFDAKEQEIIINHFGNLNLTNKELAGRSGVSHQIVTALLNSPVYKLFEARIFDRLLPTEIRIAFLRAIRGLDSKVIQQLAIQYGLLKPEKLDVELNKPLDDPKALEMLKQLGDKLSQDDKQ